MLQIRAFVLVAALLCRFSVAANALEGFDLDALEKDLAGKGLPGLVHGVVPDRHQVVIGYRDPEDMSHVIELPAIGKTAAVKAELEKLRRNDQVLMFGEFKDLDSPYPHLSLTRIEVKSKWNWSSMPEVKIPTSLAAEIKAQRVLHGKVHAVVAEGQVLLFDYKDQIFPVIVGDVKLPAGLWTNDKVDLKVTLQDFPKTPTHLILDGSKPEPVHVRLHMSSYQGEKGTLKGVLVRYPPSQLVHSENFAVQVTDEHGVREFYFLLSEDKAVQKKIVEQESALWKANLANARRYRSREINDQIQVEVTGSLINQEGAGNPQIYLSSADALHLSKRAP